MVLRRPAHCPACGDAFGPGDPFPRKCGGCGEMTFLNPLPVAVVLIPVGAGILAVRRAIEPGRGELALPGGFIEAGESWQEAGAREVWEECGLAVDPGELRAWRVLSSPIDTLLIFATARRREEDGLSEFVPNEEATERVVLTGPTQLAFRLHTQVVEEWFLHRRGMFDPGEDA